MPAEDKKLVLEIMGEIVDWVNGQAKLGTRKGTTATAQNLVREWWSCGDDLRQRVADWAVHIFRGHNKEADLWAGKGVKGREEERVDTANVVWSEVTHLCGFSDGSCERGTSSAGLMIQVFTKTLGWPPIHEKCGSVLGRNSLDLMVNLSQWIDKSLHEQ